MSLFLLTPSLYLTLSWHISLYFIRKLIIEHLLKMRAWGLGKIEGFKSWSGYKYFQCFCFWNGLTQPQIHTWVQWNLWEVFQLVTPLSTQIHFHLEFNHKLVKNHEEPVSHTPFLLIPSLKLSKQDNISNPKFISAALQHKFYYWTGHYYQFQRVATSFLCFCTA